MSGAKNVMDLWWCTSWNSGKSGKWSVKNAMGIEFDKVRLKFGSNGPNLT